VPFEVSIVEALGAESYAHGSIGGASFIVRVPADAGIKKGQTVRVALRDVHLFDANSGVSLRAAKE
jgi:sn-glycerol 3-phosphate transport system ATP-binding protein/multiple sugar transport system ATP-binding protein